MSSGPNLHATPCPGPPLNARVRARCGARTPPLPPPGSRRTTIAATAPTFVPVCRANTDTTDPDLVAAVRRGDDQAFELLYERYHRRIAAYIFGMVGDYGRAEDIAQDVFMSALRRMRETDRPIAFKPWVYEIAKNACIDQFRRSRRTEEVSYDADEGLGAVDYGKLVTTGPAPDVAVDQKMSIDHLRGAFGGLSETHHQILVMRELEGLSYREIGERLGMSRASVESTLFRARRRLSEEYEELSSGERCSRVQLIIAQAAETALGARDQRKLGKHVAHCQSCRREAHLAGLDLAVLRPRPVRSRLAALLPLPAFLRRRLEGDEGGPRLRARRRAPRTRRRPVERADVRCRRPGGRRLGEGRRGCRDDRRRRARRRSGRGRRPHRPPRRAARQRRDRGARCRARALGRPGGGDRGASRGDRHGRRPARAVGGRDRDTRPGEPVGPVGRRRGRHHRRRRARDLPGRPAARRRQHRRRAVGPGRRARRRAEAAAADR
ncbi:RNA polymerase sigma factor [Conexibacter sp. W3-3-2]|uniref:RNA polymerase sigma factor n=1 Tax=Conexibacter sp. W3-3-2 TaxID=2675227 RepID=UPI0018A897F6|nr:sigma-70 family RNA polymerase sigma factor [Conexibacter sp. W3-3-2]